MSDNSPSSRLLQLTGGVDLVRTPSVTRQVLEEVLGEIKDERIQQAKTTAKEILQRCVELEKQRREAVAGFKKSMKEYDKRLGKLVSQLERSLNNQPTVEAEVDAETEVEVDTGTQTAEE